MNAKTKTSYLVYFTFRPYIFLFYISLSLYTIALVIQCVLEFLISPSQMSLN